MSKLDDILNDLLRHDVYIDWEKTKQPQAKKQIKALMLELVGKDSKFRKPDDEFDRGVQIGYDTLRAELRDKVEDL